MTGECHAFGSQLVDLRCPDQPLPIDPKFGMAQVICENVNYIRGSLALMTGSGR